MTNLLRSKKTIVFSLLLVTLCFVIGCKEEEKPKVNLNTTHTGQKKFKNGEVAPLINLNNLDGKPVSLEKLKGKLVLVNFWGTFCASCLTEMPALQRLYQKYQRDGFEILAINLDPKDNQIVVFDFVKNNKINFVVAADPTLVAATAYGVEGLPETFFIDPDGKFISIVDPVWAEDSVRMNGDYPWDAPVYMDLVNSLLDKFIRKVSKVKPIEEPTLDPMQQSQ